MNERIRQLAIQAAGKGYQTFGTSDFDNLESIEKFAKLIAKEYGNIVLHYANVDEGVAVANKHFGVEE